MTKNNCQGFLEGTKCINKCQVFRIMFDPQEEFSNTYDDDHDDDNDGATGGGDENQLG